MRARTEDSPLEVAILLVSGGSEPREGRWIELCLRKLEEHTRAESVRVYVWNNAPEDRRVGALLAAKPYVDVTDAAPYERLRHPHAVPLQRLYAKARQARPRFVITLDSDAVRDGWLAALTGALSDTTVIAGVWRDQLRSAIAPYIHPSCLCTTRAFIEEHGLRFDFIAPRGAAIHDTLSGFTAKARELGLGLHRLERSNVRQFHRVLGRGTWCRASTAASAAGGVVPARCAAPPGAPARAGPARVGGLRLRPFDAPG